MKEKAERGGLELARIGGVQVAIDVSWLVIFALVLWSLSMGYFPERHPGYTPARYWLVGAAATLLFFASVLIHELAHAWVGNALGHEVRRITLFLFGGMAHLSGEPRSPAAEFKIAAVGPLTSLALAGVFWIGARGEGVLWNAPLWTGVLEYLAFINLALAVFNLLPGYPLDGGRLLRAWFWQRSGNLTEATARAANWGSGIALGVMLLGGLQIFSGALIGGLWLIFIGMFLRGAARAGYYGLLLDQTLGRTRVADIMVSNPVCVSPDTSVQQAIDAYFLRYGFGGFPVAREREACGLLNLAAVQRCPPEERASRKVRDVMRPAEDAIRIQPQTSAAEALRRMTEADVGRLLVSDGEHLTGLVTRSGIMRFMQIKNALAPQPKESLGADRIDDAA